ncbi:MAG: L-serine ammonia-lyase, iron-sulfur-dependent, subunit alpha [Clostridiales bacterium]|nr:L-serine ammonia-lyase, iron-sulfur-dependent, subunit alpha [Clostridiales bacterium]
MDRNSSQYKKCVEILKEELVPAMGCTEPIAVAYCAALAKQYLGCMPDRVLVEASGNIIKNVKSVVVPNTDHMRGLPVAAAAGIAAGDPEKKLQVISGISKEQIDRIGEFLNTAQIEVMHLDTGRVFDLIVTVYKDDHYASCRIMNYHTNVVHIEKDGVTILDRETDAGGEQQALTDRDFLSCSVIYDFVESVDIEDVRDVIERQISFNMAIAEEGIRNKYGAEIGQTLLKGAEALKGNNEYHYIREKAKAYAAAGSDARMNGCEMPVVINSGSGNQGITATVPVVIFAEHLGVSEEKKIRALVLSNLIAIYQKYPIGRLSAYCGAVNAGAGAGCGIAYLYGEGIEGIEHTLVNALAIASGVICDGAKASCAAKISLSVDNGIFGYEMWKNGSQFLGGEGIIKKGSDNVIKNVGRLAHDGMKETDKEILRIMLSC